MNNWWGRLSLKNKLQIPTQLTLMVVLVAAQLWAFDLFEKRMLDSARQKAEAAADSVINDLNILMMNGSISDPEQRKLYVKKMGSADSIVELRVIRGKAVTDQYGKGLEEAGEQGRGFAVVADEVRKLAEKSAQSASQIDEVTQALGEQSDKVEANIKSGMQSLQTSQAHVKNVTALLEQSNALVGGVNSGVDSITASVQEQRRVSGDVASHVEEIADLAQANNMAIHDMERAVKDMESLAVSLKGSVNQFKV